MVLPPAPLKAEEFVSGTESPGLSSGGPTTGPFKPGTGHAAGHRGGGSSGGFTTGPIEADVCRLNRPVREYNKVEILHVRCAVADSEWLSLSSANLTWKAFAINMELGMLIRGGTSPKRVEQQFVRMISAGNLKAVSEFGPG